MVQVAFSFQGIKPVFLIQVEKLAMYSWPLGFISFSRGVLFAFHQPLVSFSFSSSVVFIVETWCIIQSVVQSLEFLISDCRFNSELNHHPFYIFDSSGDGQLCYAMVSRDSRWYLRSPLIRAINIATRPNSVLVRCSMNGAGRHAWQPESPKCLVKMINKWLSLLFSFLPLIKKKLTKVF